MGVWLMSNKEQDFGYSEGIGAAIEGWSYITEGDGLAIEGAGYAIRSDDMRPTP